MSKERELRCWQQLQASGHIARSQVPTGVRKSAALAQLLNAEIVAWQRQGNGKVLRLVEPVLLAEYVAIHFPGNELAATPDSFSNLQRYRSTKAASRQTKQVLLLRGNDSVILNGQSVDLGYWTRQMGCMAAVQPELKADKVCVVENLDCFLRAEDVLGDNWVLLHPYGRLGKDSLTKLQATTLLHFGDYDFTGLDEYLRLRQQHPHAQLYLPQQLEELWQRYATPIKTGAVPTKRLQQCTLAEVHAVMTLLASTHRFLEQQALFVDTNAEL